MTEQSGDQRDMPLDPVIVALVDRLAQAEAALVAALGPQIDAVVDPDAALPLMLRQAQESLRASEGRYCRLIARLPALVFELLPDGTTTYANPTFWEITDYQPDELLGKNWWAILTKVTDAPRYRELRQRLSTGDVTGELLSIFTKRGHEVILEVNTANRYAADGAVQQIIAIAIDVTDRIRAEQAQQEAQRVLTTIYRQSPEILVISTLVDGRYLMVNEAFERIIGYRRDEAEGKTSAELHLFDDPREREHLLTLIQRDGAVRNLEVRYRKRNGDLLVGLTAMSQVEIGGQPCLISTVTDISELKEIETALRKSEERFRLVAENADDIIYLYRLQPPRGFQYVNPAATRITGYTPEEHYTDPDLGYRLVLPEDCDKLEALIMGSISTHEPLVMRWVRKDGVIIWTEQRNAPLYDEAGQLQALIGIARDMTQRKRAEEDRDVYLHTISHDLRLPLTVIRGHTHLLEESMVSSGAGQEEMASLAAILRATRRMDAMIQDLVDAARLEGQQLVLDRQALQLGSYLFELLGRAAGALEVSRVSVEIAQDFPPVCADPLRLERVLYNLISNALKNSPRESAVVMRITQEGGFACITITDQGHGIHPDDLPYLFNRFYRARNARSGEGIGLGLYISKMLVEAHGGAIGVHSTLGAGSTFWFTLPLVAVASR